jgi:drug/metabolite transporter (DMT)-like permease
MVRIQAWSPNMNPFSFTNYSSPLLVLASAALFGASTPVAKLLLGVTDPVLLAGLLYLGSGIGLGIIGLCTLLFNKPAEAPLRERDLPWLGLIILFGGVLGPALLMAGLTSASGGAGSLLLNTESLATMVIAWIFFRENVDRRVFAGAMAIFAGALVLSWRVDGGAMSVGWGSGLIVAACICWGIDKNLTRKLSAADPIQIARSRVLPPASSTLRWVLPMARGCPKAGPLSRPLSLVFSVTASALRSLYWGCAISVRPGLGHIFRPLPSSALRSRFPCSASPSRGP